MNESLNAGATISHYCVTGKLGAGGMGEVYCWFTLRPPATRRKRVSIHHPGPELDVRFETMSLKQK